MSLDIGSDSTAHNKYEPKKVKYKLLLFNLNLIVYGIGWDQDMKMWVLPTKKVGH